MIKKEDESKLMNYESMRITRTMNFGNAIRWQFIYIQGRLPIKRWTIHIIIQLQNSGN